MSPAVSWTRESGRHGPCTSPGGIAVDATDSTGNAQALELPVALTTNSIQLSGAVVKVSLSGLADSNVAGTVKFSAASSKNSDTVNFAESSLSAGLVSGNPVLTYVGGTAAPGTYGPLRDGLILTSCNSGPFQQFVPQSDGTLRNLATGLYVNPNGTGSQLRGAAAPVRWGGSGYGWKDYTDLPG